MQFSKALAHLNVSSRAAVALMAFNAPEWIMTMLGAINYNAVITGIYITNTPDACLYQVNHAKAEVVVCDSIEKLKGFTVNMDKMPQVMAYVVFGVDSLPAECKGPKIYLWNDFLKIGKYI